MKKIVVAFFVTALVLPVVVSANEDKSAEYLELCQGYAKEDGVEKADLQEYLESCVKDLQESAAKDN